MKYFWPAYKYLAIFGNILISIETEVWNIVPFV
jgi:hypothetical protein